MGLLEIASATLRGGEQRLEIAAQNAVNTETAGYKAQFAIDEILATDPQLPASTSVPSRSVDQIREQGVLFETGNPLDLAINGPGYILLRSGEEFSLSRGGQFSIGANGALVDAQGKILQLASGGDASASTNNVEILPDGTMLDEGVPIGTIAMFDSPDRPDGRAISVDEVSRLEESGSSELRQAMLEKSNVTLSDEMIELIRAQRQVESGAQIIRAYDQLLDRAITTFGRNAS